MAMNKISTITYGKIYGYGHRAVFKDGTRVGTMRWYAAHSYHTNNRGGRSISTRRYAFEITPNGDTYSLPFLPRFNSFVPARRFTNLVFQGDNIGVYGCEDDRISKMVDYIFKDKRYCFNNEMSSWFEKNKIYEPVIVSSNKICFAFEEDLVAFKLKWL